MCVCFSLKIVKQRLWSTQTLEFNMAKKTKDSLTNFKLNSFVVNLLLFSSLLSLLYLFYFKSKYLLCPTTGGTFDISSIQRCRFGVRRLCIFKFRSPTLTILWNSFSITRLWGNIFMSFYWARWHCCLTKRSHARGSVSSIFGCWTI